MAIWRIPFVSLYGIEYEVQIGGMTAARTLVGGAKPFVTQEDNDADMFKPVRLQSGYLSFVDNGYDANGYAIDWKELIPATSTSHPVTLIDSNNNEVLWRGYVKPETYSGLSFEKVQERQIPVQCQLSVLAGFEIDPSAATTPNFAWLLNYILTKEGTWSDIVFDGNDAVEDWLLKCVQWSGLQGVDDNGVDRSIYDCLEMLEYVCVFFGVTCRWSKDKLYFSCHDSALYPYHIGITMQDLALMGNAGMIPQYSTISEERYDLGDVDYMSTNNTEEIIMGVRKATVTADVQNKEVALSVPFDAIAADLAKNPPTSYVEHNNIVHFEKTAVPSTSVMGNISVGYMGPLDQDFAPASFTIEDDWDLTNDGPLTYMHNYDWTCYRKLSSIQGASWPNEWIKISSSAYNSFDHGVMVINGTIESPQGGGALLAKLKVGDKWWSGSAWTNTESTFQIIFGNERDSSQSGDLSITDTRQRNDPYPAYNGKGIVVSSSIGGGVELYLGLQSLALAPTGGGINVEIKELSISFLRNVNYAPNSDRSTNVYTASNGSDFTDTVSLHSIFASDNGNNYGLGIILEPDGGYCSLLRYSTYSDRTDEHPEQHLADRMASFGSVARSVLNLEMKWPDIYAMTPNDEVDGQSDAYYPLSVSNDWREDVAIVRLIQL